MHDRTAAFTGRFASRQHKSLARPVGDAAVASEPNDTAVCPPDGLSGSSGREGTTDNPSTGDEMKRLADPGW